MSRSAVRLTALAVVMLALSACESPRRVTHQVVAPPLGAGDEWGWAVDFTREEPPR